MEVKVCLYCPAAWDVATCGMQKRFRNVEEINLEFAQDVEDKHLTAIAFKVCAQKNLYERNYSHTVLLIDLSRTFFLL